MSYYDEFEVVLERGAHRVVARLDYHSEQPYDHGAPFTALIGEDRGDYYWTFFNAEYDDPDYLQRAHEHFYQHTDVGSRADTWDIVKRFYKVFHDQDIHVSHHHGYSQGDEWTLVSVDSEKWRDITGVTAPIAECEFMDAVNWARGDVYIFTHEYNHMLECHAGDDWAWCGEPGHNEDNPEGEWETVESVGGFYVQFPNEREHGEWIAGEFLLSGNPFLNHNLRKAAA